MLTPVVCLCGRPIGHVADFVRHKLDEIFARASRRKDGSVIVDENTTREVFRKMRIHNECCMAKIIVNGDSYAPI